jgi:hypothetical protein
MRADPIVIALVAALREIAERRQREREERRRSIRLVRRRDEEHAA